MMMTTTLHAGIAYMLRQGADLSKFRTALASRFGVNLEEVDAAIAAAGPTRIVNAETVAQERLAEERRYRHTSAYRRFHHEED